jgi:SAM-dependent methyltransferase
MRNFRGRSGDLFSRGSVRARDWRFDAGRRGGTRAWWCRLRPCVTATSLLSTSARFRTRPGSRSETRTRPRRGLWDGYLLRELTERLPAAQALCGIDPATRMIQVARSVGHDPRLSSLVGVAEELPYEDSSFDLVTSTTSFDHWRDQQRGLVECARVLHAGGRLVLGDLFSLWLVPTLIGSRRKKARTRGRVTGLLRRAGFDSPEWRSLKTPLIAAFEAREP